MAQQSSLIPIFVPYQRVWQQSNDPHPTFCLISKFTRKITNPYPVSLVGAWYQGSIGPGCQKSENFMGTKQRSMMSFFRFRIRIRWLQHGHVPQHGFHERRILVNSCVITIPLVYCWCCLYFWTNFWTQSVGLKIKPYAPKAAYFVGLGNESVY